MMYNIHSGIILWQLPDLLSHDNSKACIPQRLLLKIVTWKVLLWKFRVKVMNYTNRNGSLRWQMWTFIQCPTDAIPCQMWTFIQCPTDAIPWQMWTFIQCPTDVISWQMWKYTYVIFTFVIFAKIWPVQTIVTDRQTDRQRDRQTDRQTDGQTDGRTYGRTDRETDRQTDR